MVSVFLPIYISESSYAQKKDTHIHTKMVLKKVFCIVLGRLQQMVLATFIFLDFNLKKKAHTKHYMNRISTWVLWYFYVPTIIEPKLYSKQLSNWFTKYIHFDTELIAIKWDIQCWVDCCNVHRVKIIQQSTQQRTYQISLNQNFATIYVPNIESKLYSNQLSNRCTKYHRVKTLQHSSQQWMYQISSSQNSIQLKNGCTK